MERRRDDRCRAAVRDLLQLHVSTAASASIVGIGVDQSESRDGDKKKERGQQKKLAVQLHSDADFLAATFTLAGEEGRPG